MRSRGILGLTATALGALFLFWLLVPLGKNPIGVPLVRAMWGYRPEVEKAMSQFFRIRDTIRVVENLIVGGEFRARADGLRARAPDEIVVVADTGVSEVNRATADSTAREELRALGVTRPAAPIHVIVTRAEPTTTFPVYRRAIALPDSAGQPCVVIWQALGPTRHLRIQGYDRLLGTCGFYAVYGAPGAGMRDWLKATRLRRAALLQFPEYLSAGPITEPTVANAVARVPFVAECLRRELMACDSVFFAAGVDYTVFVGRVSAAYITQPVPSILVATPQLFRGSSSALLYGMLAQLAADLGPERFGALWRSEEPVAVAFERVTGRPLGVGIHEYLKSRVPQFEAGPNVRWYQWLATIVVLVAAMGGALAFPKRRLS